MTVPIAVLLVLAVTYGCYLTWLLYGFKRVTRHSGTFDDLGPAQSVTVVLPARNEEKCIEACLASIFSSDYDAQLFDVIVVDDDSSDATREVVTAFGARHHLGGRLRLLAAAPIKHSHKKGAISAAVAASDCDLILATDADVVVGRRWMSAMVCRFNSEIDFVAGPVAYPGGDSFVAQLIALEMFGLVGVAAGSIGIGFPSLCNGANMAFRRATFERIGGFSSIDHVSSGDDVMLMLKMAANKSGSVAFCAQSDAVVDTEQVRTTDAFVNQRLRWVSKTKHYTGTSVILQGILVYGFHVSLLVAFLFAFVVSGLWQPVGIAFLIKIGAEGSLLYAACAHFGRRRLLRTFIPGQLLQIPYVVGVGMIGLTRGSFTWKGRELAR